MKTPLLYQMTEYDCGPTTMLNAVRYLFDREKVPPEIVRNIMLYSLDAFGKGGTMGKSGTSRMAMMFLSGWLQSCGESGILPVRSRYLSKEQAHVGADGLLIDALRRGGVAVVRLFLGAEHYVLFTGVEDGAIRLFDPYYADASPDPDVRFVADEPYRYNRVVPMERLQAQDERNYAMGEIAGREAVLLFNTATMQTEEETIEYFI